MNTNVSNCISNTEQEEKEITMLCYGHREETGASFVRLLRPILKGFGLLSTFLWGAAALSPNTFRIPVSQQGWVFTIAVIWFFSYCAGLFNL